MFVGYSAQKLNLSFNSVGLSYFVKFENLSEKIKEQKSLTLKKEHNIDNASSNDFSLSANKSNPSLFCDLITNVIKGISLSTKANQHHHTAQIYQNLPGCDYQLSSTYHLHFHSIIQEHVRPPSESLPNQDEVSKKKYYVQEIPSSLPH